MRFRVGLMIVLLLSFASFMVGQTSERSTAFVSVPPVIDFSNVAVDPAGNPLTGTMPITFSLYNNAQGGGALWTETQSVTLDNSGHYNVYLGISKSKGLPLALFTTGQALWLGVQIAGEAEPQRVALVSVPYAMKAGDAATIGGLPPSAFVMSNSTGSHSSGKKANPASETQNFIPVFIDSSGDLGDSILFQLGMTAVGINTTTPSATLEVNGTGKFDGPVSFASGQTFPGTLTGIKAGTGITVSGSTTDPTVGINTTFANEYYAQLKASNTFTANQTVNGTMTATNFSGNGSGLTNVTATNSNELGGLAPSAFAQLAASSNTFTGSVTASSFTGSGTGLSNVNAAELGGMPPSAFQPAGSYATTGANSFTGNQSVTGNVSATGSISAGASTFTGLVTESGALLPPTGTATPAQGYNSNATDLVASAYNSTAGGAQNQDFRWQTEPSGNNTGSPSGTLNLLFGSNGAAPSETGVSVASTGTVTASQLISNAAQGIAPLQVTSTAVVPNLNASLLGGNAASAFQPAGSYATLGTNNFAGSQSVTGDITASGTGAGNITASGEVQGGVLNATTTFDLGGSPFVYGTNDNTLLGFGISSAGSENTASGYQALSANTGTLNTASGFHALYSNTTGSYNTGSGRAALYNNTTGNLNTAGATKPVTRPTALR